MTVVLPLKSQLKSTRHYVSWNTILWLVTLYLASARMHVQNRCQLIVIKSVDNREVSVKMFQKLPASVLSYRSVSVSVFYVRHLCFGVKVSSSDLSVFLPGNSWNCLNNRIIGTRRVSVSTSTETYDPR